MADNREKKNRRTTDPISIEFLVNTLASVQTALSNIDKETSEKTEALYAISETISTISENLKSINESTIREDDKINSLIQEVKVLTVTLDKSALQLENTFEILSNEKNSDLKEIKYALQDLNKNFVALVAGLKSREPAKEEKKGWLKALIQIVNGIKNLKLIVLIVLMITVLVFTIFYGTDAAGLLWEFFKKLI